MRRFKEATRIFWTGWAEIFDYLAAVREHAWEVMWGAGVIGTVFTIATLVWSPSWRAFGYIIALVVFVAGYQLWRAYHVRLVPKLEIGDVYRKYARTGKPNEKRIFVQVAVKCRTEGPVEDCGGQLLGVFRLVNGEWEITGIDETNDLLWSYRDNTTVPFKDKSFVMLEHGAPRRLNVFFVENTSTNIVTRTEIPMRLPYAPSDNFRFDVRVAGKDGLAEYIHLKVTFGDHWNDLVAEIIGNET